MRVGGAGLRNTDDFGVVLRIIRYFCIIHVLYVFIIGQGAADAASRCVVGGWDVGEDRQRHTQQVEASKTPRLHACYWPTS